MFSSFWGGLATLAIFFAAYSSWKNGQALKKINDDLFDVQNDLNRLSNQMADRTYEEVSPKEAPKKETEKPQPEAPIKPSNEASKSPQQVSTKAPENKPKFDIPHIISVASKVAAANVNEEKQVSEKLATSVADETLEISDSKQPQNSAWAFRNLDEPEQSVENDKTEASEPHNIEDIWQKFSNFEFNLGAKLPVWLGSIALIVSGFFFVKYSVENNLVPPYIRLIILFVLGAVMVAGAELIRKRPNFANGRRISQALTGVGFATIYGVLFAGSQIWQYIPVSVAAVGMILTTLATLFMSIRYGIGVAYLALITAYLTPILMNSKESSTLFLFAYILGIFTAMAYVARLQKWWSMLLILLIGNFAWVGYWYYLIADANEAIWVNIFLVAQSAVIVWSMKPLMGVMKNTSTDKAEDVEVQEPESQRLLGKVINFGAHIGGLLFLSQIMLFAQFSLADWSIFNVVMLASVALAKYDEDNFIYMPFAAATLGAFMFGAWHTGTLSGLSMQMLLAIFILSGFGVYQIFNSQKARIWAFLTTLTPLVYFIIYYLHVGTDWADFFVYETQIPKAAAALIAVAFSAAFAGLYVKIRNQSNIAELNNILANLAATSTAFLALGIAIFIDRSVWPIAFGVQMVALSYIDSQLKNKIIRVLTIILAALIILLILPNLFAIFNYMIVLTLNEPTFKTGVWDAVFMNAPLLYMGIPTLCFAISAFFMRRHLDDITVKIMETIALTLTTLTGYLVIRYLFNGPAHLYDFNQTAFERGVITSFIFAMGLISFWLAKYTGRAGYITRGWVNIGMAFGRIVIFDILQDNPLLDLIPLSGVTIFNPLIFSYALPIAWVFAVQYLLPENTFEKAIKYLKIFAALLFFAFINLNVRFAYQDYLVYWQSTSIAEIYTYSIVWLLSGIFLLILAIWQQAKILRYASQLLIMLTVTKVFLYDAANLEGLYRIASFAILGVCLIVISSVYSKYILIEAKPDDQPKDTADITDE